MTTTEQAEHDAAELAERARLQRLAGRPQRRSMYEPVGNTTVDGYTDADLVSLLATYYAEIWAMAEPYRTSSQPPE